MNDLMLYYHIPFCVSKCAYCSFYSIPDAGESIIEAYTEALIRQTKAFGNAKDYAVRSIYFGGGTPTFIGAKRLNRILFAVYDTFSINDDAEITVEVNPCTIDKDGLSLLKSSGVNRLSIGAQSFNDDTLKLLNRAHSSDDFVNCFSLARRVGFSNLSTDLIFALPNETTEHLSNSVKRLISLGPEHISVYGLGIEEGTPLYNNKSIYRFPSEDEEEEQYSTLCALLEEAGYRHYEISNFAKIGYESQHNSGYWKRVPYFGFGAGAHSFFENRRFEAAKNIVDYINNSYGSLTTPTDYKNATPLTEEEAKEERVMLGLRLSDGVKITKPVPKYLIDTGLVKCYDNVVSLTEKGFRVSNSIINLLI